MDDHEDDYREFDDDGYDEPSGSCENCGVNLYPGDHSEYCDQCLYYLNHS